MLGGGGAVHQGNASNSTNYAFAAYSNRPNPGANPSNNPQQLLKALQTAMNSFATPFNEQIKQYNATMKIVLPIMKVLQAMPPAAEVPFGAGVPTEAPATVPSIAPAAPAVQKYNRDPRGRFNRRQENKAASVTPRFSLTPRAATASSLILAVSASL